MFNKKLLPTILLSTAALAFSFQSNIAVATPLTNTLSGGGCIINVADYADDVLSFTSADLVKAHGVLAPGTTITHVVNFAYDFGVTDPSCAGAVATISLAPSTLTPSSTLTFDSLVLTGGINNVSIVNNTGALALTLTMTTKNQIGVMATPFTYSVPFTINANVTMTP